MNSVLVSAVDSKDNPKEVEVYLFPATDVRKRFDDGHKARTAAGREIPDNFGMWVDLDMNLRGVAASVGSGIAENYDPIATYRIANSPLKKNSFPDDEKEGAVATNTFKTIGEVLSSAREQIAKIAGVPLEAVKLDLRLEA